MSKFKGHNGNWQDMCRLLTGRKPVNPNLTPRKWSKWGGGLKQLKKMLVLVRIRFDFMM